MITRRPIGENSELVVDAMAAAEVAAIGFWYPRGSRDETQIDAAGINDGSAALGSCHFIEHMLFKGTGHRSPFAIAREIDRLGGSLNAFTEREAIVLTALVPKEGYSAALEILCDMAMDSVFDPAEVERERGVIINELVAAAEDPEEAAADAWFEDLWPGHPLSRRIGGTIGDVERLDAAALASVYRNYFCGQPALVSIAGGIDADWATAEIERRFSGMPLAPARDLIKRQPPPLAGPRAKFCAASPHNVQIFYGVYTSGSADPVEYYAAQIANSAIGEAMSSRLFQELREKRALCYTVGSSIATFSDSFLWSAYAASTVEDAPALADNLVKEIRKVIIEGIDRVEIDDAKAHLIGAVKLASADYEYRMRRIARHRLNGGEPYSLERAIELLGGATADEVAHTIAGRMGPAPLLYAYGDRRSQTGVRRIFETAIGQWS